MFIRLLSACTTARLVESLASNSKKQHKICIFKQSTCQSRPRLFNINSNQSRSVNINKCGWSYNGINDPYAGICVPDKVKIWM